MKGTSSNFLTLQYKLSLGTSAVKVSGGPKVLQAQHGCIYDNCAGETQSCHQLPVAVQMIASLGSNLQLILK